MFKVCFEARNIRTGRSTWLFARRHAMRFEFLALLAYRRSARQPDQSWVEIKEIARLPHWQGKSRHHIATNVGRYLQEFDREGRDIVTARNYWAGPYRLNFAPSSITFDVPIQGVRKQLRISEQPSTGRQEDYIRFTWLYVEAEKWVYTGHLSTYGNEERLSAYRQFLRLAEDTRYPVNLRLLAAISAMRVQYMLGFFQGAEKTLEDFRHLLRRTTDASLKARYYLAVAWGMQRRASGSDSNKGVETALNLATSFAVESGDRAVLGEVADRMGGYLTKRNRHAEAIDSMLHGLEAHLITGSFDRVQACCANIGSVVHRLNEPHYQRARLWLLLSLRISHWMQCGRYSAHPEIILAKMDIEMDRKSRAKYWIKKAERVASHAYHQIDLADVKMIDALWHQSFGNRPSMKRLVIDAVNSYRKLANFDVAAKEQYMARKFPEVWQDVIALLGKWVPQN